LWAPIICIEKIEKNWKKNRELRGKKSSTCRVFGQLATARMSNAQRQEVEKNTKTKSKMLFMIRFLQSAVLDFAFGIFGASKVTGPVAIELDCIELMGGQA